MDDDQLAKQQPKDIGEALVCMRSTLEHFHGRRDKRAIFLHVYYEMTLEVHDAIQGRGDYAGQSLFLDAQWVERLSGRFATLYFRSLTVTGSEHEGKGSRAWKCAHKMAQEPRSTVLLNALLGINAHINDDLAKAIAHNLDPAELDEPATLQMRKFDHDQVNNMLVRALGRIQDILAHDYDPGLGLGDRLFGRLDERLSQVGLTHYRERVWWDALTYAAALAAGKEAVIGDKLDWESHKVAQFLVAERWVWGAERLLGLPWRFGGKQRWDRIRISGPDDVRTAPALRVTPHT